MKLKIERKKPKISIILGLPFHNVSMLDALRECKRAIEDKKPSYFVTANLDFAAQAYKDEELKSILFYADRVLCDGLPLVWVSHLFSNPLVERVSGADLIPDVLNLCSINGYSVYFFGPKDSTLRDLMGVIKKKYPDLKIAGYQSPPVGNLFDWDNISIAGEIKKTKPDLLLVSLGFPKQERWIYMYHKKIGVPLSIGIGATIDFMTGKQKRAPRFMQKMGMEWFWRFMTHPVRMFRRYARDLLFLFRATIKQQKTLKKAKVHYTPKARREVTTTSTHYTIAWAGKVSREKIQALQMPPDFENNVICECSGVSFIDSAGLGHLAHLARQCHKKGNYFCVYKASPVVTKAIKMMRLEKQIPLISTAEQVHDALKCHTEALVLTKNVNEGQDLIIKPLVNLNMETVGKIESAIYDSVPNLDDGASVLIDLEKIEFMDSMAVAALISIKNNLKKIDMELWLVMVHGHPMHLLKTLKLEKLLVRAASGTLN